jgi:hypothetical protein
VFAFDVADVRILQPLQMEQEHKVEEAKLATERMSESLRTLNGIFRNMQVCAYVKFQIKFENKPR